MGRATTISPTIAIPTVTTIDGAIGIRRPLVATRSRTAITGGIEAIGAQARASLQDRNHHQRRVIVNAAAGEAGNSLQNSILQFVRVTVTQSRG